VGGFQKAMGWLAIIEGVPITIAGAIIGLPSLLNAPGSEKANGGLVAFLWGVFSLTGGWGMIKGGNLSLRQQAVGLAVMSGCCIAGGAYFAGFVPNSGACPGFALVLGVFLLVSGMRTLIKARK
jgi:hypothetical protein